MADDSRNAPRKPPQGPATGADRPRPEPHPGPHSPAPPSDDKSRDAERKGAWSRVSRGIIPLVGPGRSPGGCRGAAPAPRRRGDPFGIPDFRRVL